MSIDPAIMGKRDVVERLTRDAMNEVLVKVCVCGSPAAMR